MYRSVARLAALLFIVAAGVGGCRGGGDDEVMIDGHVRAVPPAGR